MNTTQRNLSAVGLLALLLGLGIFLLQPSVAEAGIFDDSSTVTYKEYWVPHSEFTGGFNSNTCADEGANWFLEPWPAKCGPKTMEFTIPDDISGAVKAEIYLDLWRNQRAKYARFTLNGSSEYAPNVGADWGRTPYVGEVALSDLQQGNNTVSFTTTGGGYHIHDMAIRVYYNDANPIVAGSGSDVVPPNGSLVTVQGDGAAIAAGTGGVVMVDGNELTLTASVTGNADYVEFHGYYFGYDEDSDGKFLDWHSRGHNNWYPGGADELPTGGTIDHIGTVKVNGDGQYSVTWDMAHVPDQTGVKFKVRVVDSAGNVRDAAGGVSTAFELKRTNPVVAFYNPGFEDLVLWLEGSKPREVSRDFTLPADIGDYQNAIVVHSFWRFPTFELNGSGKEYYPDFPLDPNDNNDDHWQLAINSVNSNYLQAGTNEILYRNKSTANAGEFVEWPGPMILVQRKPGLGADSKPPEIFGQYPEPNSDDAEVNSKITLSLFDSRSGIDKNSIVMRVNGSAVTPQIAGSKYNYILSYNPPVDFTAGEEVTVSIDACDTGGRCLTNESYSFTVFAPAEPWDFVSDDFNSCELDTNTWTWVDPVGDASVTVNGAQAIIEVPAGVNHDLWKSNRKYAPRLMQPVSDTDFAFEAKFDSIVEERFQLQGLLIEESETRYLRFGVQHNGTDVTIQAYSMDGTNNPTKKLDKAMDHSPSHILVERTDDLWKMFWSDDGESWEKVAQFTEVIEVTQVGVFAGNSSNPAGSEPAFTGVIDYAFDRYAPIDPEDANPLHLPVTIVGEGTVDADPLCGNPVTLTATPAEGWSFEGWASGTGTIDSTNNPYTTAFTAEETMTATFTQDEYLLDVVVENLGDGTGGSVSAEPDQEIYYYGDEVTLTATTPDGWEFVGWTGDVDDVADPSAEVISFTMSGDRDITATFARSYSVELDVVARGDGAGGSAEISPVQESYLYGDEITLTAVADAGWQFVGWEGAGLSDEDAAKPSVMVTVTDDLDISAVFAQEVTLTINVVGQGSVAVDPTEAVYLHGEQVTLTATPDDGWYFSDWSGDVVGNNNPRNVVLSGDTVVTATFTDQPPTIQLFLPVILKQ